MKIVIVDNDAALLRSLQILFSRQGYEVKVFDDPIEACSYVAKGARIDVLIIDYVMPALSGKETLRKMRGHLSPACKVILVSGHTDLIENQDLEAMGVDVFLPKPLDINQLGMQICTSCGDLGAARN